MECISRGDAGGSRSAGVRHQGFRVPMQRNAPRHHRGERGLSRRQQLRPHERESSPRVMKTDDLCGRRSSRSARGPGRREGRGMPRGPTCAWKPLGRSRPGRPRRRARLSRRRASIRRRGSAQRGRGSRSPTRKSWPGASRRKSNFGVRTRSWSFCDGGHRFRNRGEMAS